jgi:hypothetical protein
VRTVEQAMPGVSRPFTGVLVIRHAQGYNPNVVVSGQHITKDALRERLDLDHTDNHHYANSGVQRPDVRHELVHGLAAVHHRIDEDDRFPPLNELVGEFFGLFGMDAAMIEIDQ